VINILDNILINIIILYYCYCLYY